MMLKITDLIIRGCVTNIEVHHKSAAVDLFVLAFLLPPASIPLNTQWQSWLSHSASAVLRLLPALPFRRRGLAKIVNAIANVSVESSRAHEAYNPS